MIEIPLKHTKCEFVESSNLRIDLENTFSLPILLRIEEDLSSNISIMLDYSDTESKENFEYGGIVIAVGKKTGRVYRFVISKSDYLNSELMDKLKYRLFNHFENRYRNNVYNGLDIVDCILQKKVIRIGL